VFSLFERINQQFDCAILLVTHDPRLAARCARQVVLVDGRIQP
jgi:lipoprotein-releasing system ATP-binding protein